LESFLCASMYKTNEDYNPLMMSALSMFAEVCIKIIWMYAAETTLRTLDKAESATRLPQWW
ncbi:hypothetical protein CEXT_704671, partial [Caerostris extrusa]